MDIVVSTSGLTKEFSSGFWRRHRLRALDGLSFEIPRGGVFGLLGPNGAGKSTTLKLVMNLLRPTAGRAALFGRSPSDIDARRRVGFLPEHPTFYDQLTAEELLAYFGGLFGYAAADRRRRATELLDLVGLGADRRRPLRQYSKGMIQRVGIAQALVNDPELVILDEPMSGLDPLGRREVRELIVSLRDAGRTVLFSSHILSDAEALCSRVGILARGRLRASGPLDDLLRRAAEGAGASRRGTDMVVSGLSEATAERLGAVARKVTRIAEGRYSVEFPADVRPEPIIGELAAAGASLVSVTPLRMTLEDVFVQALGAADAGAGPGAAS